MQTVLITGGTGMIGQALAKQFIATGYEVIIISRNPKRSSREHLSYAKWDVEKSEIDLEALSKADIIVHLAGEGVADKRWTVKRKQAIVDSRVQSGNLLVKALSENKHKVKTFIAASAIGWYGPDTVASLEHGFEETNAPDNSFLGNTCLLWEQSTAAVANMGIRLVTLRIGIVLNKKGGALAEFLKPAKFALAVILGTGKQIISWIHQSDLCKMIQYAIETPALQGIYNAVAPNPVTNKKLVLTIAKNTYPIYFPSFMPGFLLKIILGEMSIEILKSTNVSAEKIQNAGFVFDYPVIDEAIINLIK
ncbi:MAG: TIGR01777 family protein [Chitinophagia bacterium]|nr:TIGR01777 family protein [Chitinophagia bacterium]NCA29514.1 TIGR01777 family protein [Chitinophagia bacterium]NDD15490.1 TIGR01777 family protein [Chitinophagia bacterium]